MSLSTLLYSLTNELSADSICWVFAAGSPTTTVVGVEPVWPERVRVTPAMAVVTVLEPLV